MKIFKIFTIVSKQDYEKLVTNFDLFIFNFHLKRWIISDMDLICNRKMPIGLRFIKYIVLKNSG
jgi:hypothetical protein